MKKSRRVPDSLSSGKIHYICQYKFRKKPLQKGEKNLNLYCKGVNFQKSCRFIVNKLTKT